MTLVENRTNEQPQVEQPKAEQAKPKQPKAAKVLQPTVEAQPKLQPMGEDEKATRATVFVQPKIVDDTFSFRFAEKGPRYSKTVRFDFSDCTPEDLINLALKSARIDLQSKLRAMGEKGRDATAFAKCNVKLDLLNSTREPVDPTVAACRRLMAILDCTEGEALAVIEAEQRKRAAK